MQGYQTASPMLVTLLLRNVFDRELPAKEVQLAFTAWTFPRQPHTGARVEMRRELWPRCGPGALIPAFQRVLDLGSGASSDGTGNVFFCPRGKLASLYILNTDTLTTRELKEIYVCHPRESHLNLKN